MHNISKQAETYPETTGPMSPAYICEKQPPTATLNYGNYSFPNTRFHQPFHSYDLIPHRLYVLEALLVDKAVDQYESLTVFDVQVAHWGELFGPSGVKDLQHRGRGVHLDLLAVKILYGGVVLLNERPGHKLHSEGGFPDPTAAQDHHFILAHRGI